MISVDSGYSGEPKTRDMMIFLPLLLLYSAFVLVASTNSFAGDQGRYVMFANNLSQGFYSPQNKVNLWNGPGYPIVLLPFVFLHLPWLTAKLLNALFLFLAIIYFYHTLILYIKKRPALWFSFLLGLYPPFFVHIHLLLSETLVIFLISGFLFHFCKVHQDKKRPKTHLLLTSFYLGYLALTKVFFGYVVLTGILMFFLLYLFKRENSFKQDTLIYLIAFLLCTPYLLYTYTVTGKVLYWGNSGSESLYWMSSPYQNDLGNWRAHVDKVCKNPEEFREHHRFFEEISKHDSIGRDEALKRKAVHNIMHNPIKYLYNWVANVGRMLFSYPFSNAKQTITTYFFIVPNMFIVVFSVISIYPTYLSRRLIPYEIFSLLIFGLISFGGSSLVSAYNRQFLPIVPVVSLWIIFILTRTLKIEVRR